jgi:hypothetical protein
MKHVFCCIEWHIKVMYRNKIQLSSHLTESRSCAVIFFGHVMALCYSHEVHYYMLSKGGEFKSQFGTAVITCCPMGYVTLGFHIKTKCNSVHLYNVLEEGRGKLLYHICNLDFILNFGNNCWCSRNVVNSKAYFGFIVNMTLCLYMNTHTLVLLWCFKLCSLE